MIARIAFCGLAAIAIFVWYAFFVPALLSADSVACILLGMLFLALPLVGAVIFFVETFKGTRNE